MWSTAYRMLFTRANVKEGDRVLVQGSSGGVANAAIRRASAVGAVVSATARPESKRANAIEAGATTVLAPDERVPERVDVVIKTVGEATWRHSIRTLRPGGTLVIAGATTGGMPPADLHHIFYRQLPVVGSVLSTRSEFIDMLTMLASTRLRPVIDSVLEFEDIPEGFQRLIDGDVHGKVVVCV